MAAELPHYPVIAYGDQHRLQQVMINLLANARTHTPPGTQVHTEVSVIGPEAVVTVTDNGPGILPKCPVASSSGLPGATQADART